MHSSAACGRSASSRNQTIWCSVNRLLRPTSRSGLGSKPFRDSEKGGDVESNEIPISKVRCLRQHCCINHRQHGTSKTFSSSQVLRSNGSMASSSQRMAKLPVNEKITARRGAIQQLMGSTVALDIAGFGAAAGIRKRTHRGRLWRNSLSSLSPLTRDPYS